MIIDGRAIAEDIKYALKKTVEREKITTTLGVVYAGSNPAIERFINRKKEFGEAIGVSVQVFHYSDDVDQIVLEQKLSALAADPHYGGIIVQLPLPEHIDGAALVDLVPRDKDVDVLSQRAKELFMRGEGELFPPVVGAIKEAIERSALDLANKKIVIVGEGKLVGKPVEAWLLHEGYEPLVIVRETPHFDAHVKEADVLILGAGAPGIIKPRGIKEGVALFDAGTSEEGGKLKGDADPSCADKCSVFTPVPGGIGPITVALLFKNLVTATTT